MEIIDRIAVKWKLDGGEPISEFPLKEFSEEFHRELSDCGAEFISIYWHCTALWCQWCKYNKDNPYNQCPKCHRFPNGNKRIVVILLTSEKKIISRETVRTSTH